MRSQNETEKLVAEITENKKILRENFQEKPNETEELYASLKGLGVNELKQIFPSPETVVEKNIFDVKSEIITSESIKKKALAVIKLANPENIERTLPENFEKDIRLLQGIFFFFLREICEDGISFAEKEQKKKIIGWFDAAVKENSWCLPEKQCEILNNISKKLHFGKTNPFIDINFANFKNSCFEANESILRILANFTSKNRKLIEEINFIREQQKSIFEIRLDKKKYYSKEDADAAIEQAKSNLKKLKALDFGFQIHDFRQVPFVNDDKHKNFFTREISCKFFQESVMEWKKGNPCFDSKNSKISDRREDRFTNCGALRHKFIYPERNKTTHISENFAIYNLFKKNNDNKKYRGRLILWALFDARKYLTEQSHNIGKLLKILNLYFVKILTPFDLAFGSEEGLWSLVFRKDGTINKNIYDNSDEIDLESVFTDDELEHFKRFMNFLYCSENEVEDFFEKYSFAIQIYLIYLTFELAKNGQNRKKHQ